MHTKVRGEKQPRRAHCDFKLFASIWRTWSCDIIGGGLQAVRKRGGGGLTVKSAGSSRNAAGELSNDARRRTGGVRRYKNSICLKKKQ